MKEDKRGRDREMGYENGRKKREKGEVERNGKGKMREGGGKENMKTKLLKKISNG